jgi:hypothetical protein
MQRAARARSDLDLDRLGLAPGRLRTHDGLREKAAGQPAPRFAQSFRKLGEPLNNARLDAEPVELLDDGRFFFHRDSPVVAA